VLKRLAVSARHMALMRPQISLSTLYFLKISVASSAGRFVNMGFSGAI